MYPEMEPPFEATSEKPFTFVSYAHRDKEIVYPIIQKLHEDGIAIWYDEGIPPSTKWLATIANKISECSTFLVFLSNNAIEREDVINEIVYALKRYKKNEIQFIPVYLEETNLTPELELSIMRIQALMKYSMNGEAFYKKLNNQCSLTQRKPIPKPTAKPVEEKRKSDKEILEELEKIIRKSIPPTAFIKVDTVGVKFEGDAIVGLGLYLCLLKALPEPLFQLGYLRNLNLNMNKLKTLPESFGHLTSLQILRLGSNQLKSLPESFGQLKSLKELYLIGNQLTVLPESFGQLTSLQTLDLYSNQLTTLPESFTQLSNLKVLQIACNLLDAKGEKILDQLEKNAEGVKITTK